MVFEKFTGAYLFQIAGEKSGDSMSNGNCLKMFDILYLCLIELLRLFFGSDLELYTRSRTPALVVCVIFTF